MTLTRNSTSRNWRSTCQRYPSANCPSGCQISGRSITPLDLTTCKSLTRESHNRCGSDTAHDGYAERDAALSMLHEKQKDRSRRITLGADKAYDTNDSVATARELNVTPHGTKNDKGRRSYLDRRTTRQPGYAISLSRRWLVEKGFAWPKQRSIPARCVRSSHVDWKRWTDCSSSVAPPITGSGCPGSWRTRTGKAQGAVRLKTGAASGIASWTPRKPHEYSLNPTSEQDPIDAGLQIPTQGSTRS
jgi:hypothetical protein